MTLTRSLRVWCPFSLAINIRNRSVYDIFSSIGFVANTNSSHIYLLLFIRVRDPTAKERERERERETER
jgi:hypothetical protein